MFDDESETSYPHMLQKGVVSCCDECAFMYNMLSPCARYWCVLVNDRCYQRVGKDGMLMCRVKNRPLSDIEWFLMTRNVYTEEVKKITTDLNLGFARTTRFMSCGNTIVETKKNL